MYCIGIDVGSTYTKYCIRKDDRIESLFMEKTPIRQKEYFDETLHLFNRNYPDARIKSCGYGKKNIAGLETISELTALAKGSYFMTGNEGIILDIGGQDTKIILQKEGQLKEFFLNDKCAAGSGMFLTSSLDMLGIKFQDIDLEKVRDMPVKLTSVCAVFAQSEIVELIAGNRSEEEILQAVLWQIFVKAKPLLSKIGSDRVLLSGGLSQISGIASFAAEVLERKCITVKNGAYLAAIGCTV